MLSLLVGHLRSSGGNGVVLRRSILEEGSETSFFFAAAIDDGDLEAPGSSNRSSAIAENVGIVYPALAEGRDRDNERLKSESESEP